MAQQRRKRTRSKKKNTEEVRPARQPGQLKERIEKAAYDRYLKRGRGPGGAMSDWLEAEKEVSGGR